MRPVRSILSVLDNMLEGNHLWDRKSKFQCSSVALELLRFPEMVEAIIHVQEEDNGGEDGAMKVEEITRKAWAVRTVRVAAASSVGRRFLAGSLLRHINAAMIVD